jgi:hypothetical protein
VNRHVLIVLISMNRILLLRNNKSVLTQPSYVSLVTPSVLRSTPTVLYRLRCFSPLTMDPAQQAATMAAAAATAAVQQMAEVYQAAPRTVSLPPFWAHDPRSWFQMAEAEFVAARYPLGGHACYVAVLKTLSTEVHQKVQDITARLTADLPDCYTQLRTALLDRFVLSPIQSSYLLLEHPPMGARTPMGLYADLQRLVPPQADTLLNAIFLQRLPDHLRET